MRLERLDGKLSRAVLRGEKYGNVSFLTRPFFAACMALNAEKITLERAVISRKLTPGKWTYSPDILEQQDLLKKLKRQFEQKHEPASGRDITWAIKLLLATV